MSTPSRNAQTSIANPDISRLDSFLRRENLLLRIHDELSRRKVVKFIEMMRARNKFKAHMARKSSARMTMIPQLEVPEIFIEDEEDRTSREAGGAARRSGTSREASAETTIVTPRGSALSPPGNNNNPFLSASEVAHAQHRSWTGAPADLSSLGAFYGPDDGAQAAHRTHASAFSFDLHEPEAGGGSNRSSRRGSTVREEQVTEMLNSSVWMDSIRRSTSMRRGQGGSEGAWGGRGYDQW